MQRARSASQGDVLDNTDGDRVNSAGIRWNRLSKEKGGIENFLSVTGKYHVLRYFQVQPPTKIDVKAKSRPPTIFLYQP